MFSLSIDHKVRKFYQHEKKLGHMKKKKKQFQKLQKYKNMKNEKFNGKNVYNKSLDINFPNFLKDKPRNLVK